SSLSNGRTHEEIHHALGRAVGAVPPRSGAAVTGRPPEQRLDRTARHGQPAPMKFLALLLPAVVLVTGCQTKPEPSAYEKIFDGRTAAGWDGDFGHTWRIQDEAFVGGSLTTTVPQNEFVATTAQFTNFVLRLEFKLLGSEGF